MNRRESWFGEREKIGTLVLFLVVSIASVRTIRFMTPWGADLQNVLAYQTCTKGGNPYLIPGGVCGDLWGRPMRYPPLLIHSFFWLRGLTLESAIYRWCSFVVVACLGCLWAWRRMIPAHRRDSADWVPVAFGLLLLFQFPMVFELERGNTDIWSIIGWTAAAFFICRSRLKLAGLAAGLAAAYKLYPAIPCAAVILGMFWASFGANRFRKTSFLRFGVPAILSFAAAQAMFYREAIWYFSRVLPDFARERGDDVSFSHSIPATCGTHDIFSSLVCLALFGTWTWACRRGLRQQPALTMAGLLAMSTYFGGIANDYGLITTYPLLMLLLIRARTTGRYGLLVLGLIAIVGDRAFFAAKDARILTPGLHLALQVAWLVLVAIEVGARWQTGPGSHDPTAEATRTEGLSNKSAAPPTHFASWRHRATLAFPCGAVAVGRVRWWTPTSKFSED